MLNTSRDRWMLHSTGRMRECELAKSAIGPTTCRPGYLVHGTCL